MAYQGKVVVAVTGASGYVAGGLISRLCADERVDRVLGYDLREPTLSHPKFVFDQIDIRNPSLEGRFRGVHVVAHLAFVMDPIRDDAEMRDVNVNGSQNVFRCAGKAGVRKVVYTSTALVYGAHPDNDLPLTEESPLRANLDFSYAAHKLEVEYVVREFREEFPHSLMTVFRPAIVFGPNVDNAWSRLLELPVLVAVQGSAPPLQFVHEDDVRDALDFAVWNDLDGAYNLCADGWLDDQDVLAIIGRRRVELPEPVAFALTDRLWQLGLAEAPAGMLHYVMHPWVMSNSKLAAAGFRAARSNGEALEATAAKARQLVRIGRARVRRSDLKRGGLAGAGLAAGIAAIGLARRRRRAA